MLRSQVWLNSILIVVPMTTLAVMVLDAVGLVRGSIGIGSGEIQTKDLWVLAPLLVLSVAVSFMGLRGRAEVWSFSVAAVWLLVGVVDLVANGRATLIPFGLVCAVLAVVGLTKRA